MVRPVQRAPKRPNWWPPAWMRPGEIAELSNGEEFSDAIARYRHVYAEELSAAGIAAASMKVTRNESEFQAACSRVHEAVNKAISSVEAQRSLQERYQQRAHSRYCSADAEPRAQSPRELVLSTVYLLLLASLSGGAALRRMRRARPELASGRNPSSSPVVRLGSETTVAEGEGAASSLPGGLAA